MDKGQSQTTANEGMHSLVSERSFAVLVAVGTILLSVLAFNLLKKKKKSAEKESGKGASTPLFISPMPTGVGSDQYDVFLSFRGLDTRKEFTDHLYHSLVNAGTIPICVFRDKNSLPIGEEFGSRILDTITRSKISIPIISENYASSKWCLRELIHIMDCKRSMSHIVLPIFYKLSPAHVRHLKGNFGKAFHSHQHRFDKKDIEDGQRALREVSDLSGWESEKFANGHEGELVKEVIKTVQSLLRHDFQLDVTEHLVGIGDHVNKIMNWVDTPTNDARMIGIYGMGGIGKTTLAKVIYNKLSNNFMHRSFLPDVREIAQRNGIPHLQSQLIKEIQPNEHQVWRVDDGISLIKSKFKGKKVLILLDDIDHKDQLDALARERSWFMTESIIIVTTRYEAVLDQSKFEVDYKYELNELDKELSLLLFNRHAFRMNHSMRDFEGISHEIISTMGGLPMALKVVGSYLYRKTDIKIWQDILKQLKKQPHRDVQKILKISYDALEDGHKEIFLDIACFFIGQKSKFAMYMWDDCGFYASQGIEELKLRCLIKVGDNGELRMHDQLRDLGRNIICQEGPLESRSRLWVYKEALRVVMGKEGTAKIQGISLDEPDDHLFWYLRQLHTYTNEQFKNLQSLRILQLGRAALSGDFNKIFSKLRWLEWFGNDHDPSFSVTNLHLPKLLVLQLSCNMVTEDWRGWSSIMAAKRLKVLALTSCYGLRCTPDLSAFMELEILILSGAGLKQVHPSIGKVKNLVSLDLSNCKSLKELSEEVGELEELKDLILDSAGIAKIPTSIGSMRKLEKLSASFCQSLREIPSSIENLSSLQHLNLKGCESLREIPSSIGNLSSLQHLNLKGCGSLREIPSSIGNLSSLQNLNLKGCGSLREIPNSIGNLSSLQHLNLKGCGSLREIPSSIGDLENLLDLEFSHSEIEKLPSTIGRLKKLRRLSLLSCRSLKGAIPSEIGDLSSLENLEISNAPISDLPESVRNLSSLQLLKLWNCEILSLPELPSGLKCLIVSCRIPRLPQLSYLIHLEEFYFGGGGLHGYIPELPSSLLKLRVINCELILPKIDGLKHLEKLSIEFCNFVKRLDISQLNCLKLLHVEGCGNLVEILVHDNLASLETIAIRECQAIQRLILPKLQCLKKLGAKCCDNLVEIRGLDRAEFLEALHITCCRSIERLPDLSGCKKLQSLVVQDCNKLTQLRGLEKLDLIYLDIFGCDSLETIPELPRTQVFRKNERV